MKSSFRGGVLTGPQNDKMARKRGLSWWRRQKEQEQRRLAKLQTLLAELSGPRVHREASGERRTAGKGGIGFCRNTLSTRSRSTGLSSLGCNVTTHRTPSERKGKCWA